MKASNINLSNNFLNKTSKTSLIKANNKNYQKCLFNINIRNKFINKGLNYFIERNNNLSNFKSLSEINRKHMKEKTLINNMNISDINKNIQQNGNGKLFPYIFKIRNNSSINQNPKKSISNFAQKKILIIKKAHF